MPFKPEVKKPGHWLGFKEVQIVDIVDKRSSHPKLEALDVALNVNLDVKDSNFTHILQIMGDFDRETDGNIKDCPLLKAINNFVNAIGFDGGVDIKGDWVDGADLPIKDIADYLNKQYVKFNPEPVTFPFYTYLYSERNKKDGKVYTRVWKKIVPNTVEDKQEFHQYVTFCKNKGYLKELDNSESNIQKIPVGSIRGDVASMD